MRCFYEKALSFAALVCYDAVCCLSPRHAAEYDCFGDCAGSQTAAVRLPYRPDALCDRAFYDRAAWFRIKLGMHRTAPLFAQDMIQALLHRMLGKNINYMRRF